MKIFKAGPTTVIQSLNSKVSQDTRNVTFGAHPLAAPCSFMVNATGTAIAQIFRKEWTLKDTPLNTVTQPVHKQMDSTIKKANVYGPMSRP